MSRKEDKDGRGRIMAKKVGDGRRHMRRRQQRTEIVLETLQIPSLWWRSSYNLLPGPVGLRELGTGPEAAAPVQLWVQEVVFH